MGWGLRLVMLLFAVLGGACTDPDATSSTARADAGAAPDGGRVIPDAGVRADAALDAGPADARPTDAAEADAGEADPCGFIPAPTASTDLVVAAVERVLSSAADTPNPSAAGVALVLDGRLVVARGLGDRSKTGHELEGQPVDRDTHFWIASTSKWMTGVAAMALVDEGRLDLAAPITTYVPDYVEANGRQSAITMAQLLTMSSGLRNDGGCAFFVCPELHVPDRSAALANLFAPMTLARPEIALINETQIGAPGSAPWHYSNFGIMLAGRAMEVAAGEPLDALVTRRLFEPASMCNATFDPQAVLSRGNYVLGEGVDDLIRTRCPEPSRPAGHGDSMEPYYPDELACGVRAPNGGVYTTPLDLGRFAEVLLHDLTGSQVILSSASAQQMLMPAGGRVPTVGTVHGDSYGITNFHHRVGGRDVYTHGGGRAGFGALFWVVPEEDFAIAIVGNVGGIVRGMVPIAEYAMRCLLDGDC